MKRHMFILILIIFSSSSLPLQLFVASAAYGVSDTLTLRSVKYGGRRNGQSSSGSANDKMATYINGSAGGNFVPVATTDYATTSSLCRTSLLFIGGTSSIVGQVPVRDGYTLIGYKGKQVRDNIHSEDLVRIFWEFYKKPKKGEVYNVGGTRFSNCSIIEALNYIKEKTKLRIKKIIKKENRIGDHILYVSSMKKFKRHYPKWKQKYNTNKIIDELIKNFDY